MCPNHYVDVFYDILKQDDDEISQQNKVSSMKSQQGKVICWATACWLDEADLFSWEYKLEEGLLDCYGTRSIVRNMFVEWIVWTYWPTGNCARRGKESLFSPLLNDSLYDGVQSWEQNSRGRNSLVQYGRKWRESHRVTVTVYQPVGYWPDPG